MYIAWYKYVIIMYFACRAVDVTPRLKFYKSPVENNLPVIDKYRK